MFRFLLPLSFFLLLLDPSRPAPLGAQRRGTSTVPSPNLAHDRSISTISPSGDIHQLDYASLYLHNYFRAFMSKRYANSAEESGNNASNASNKDVADADTAPPKFLAYAFLPSYGVIVATPSSLKLSLLESLPRESNLPVEFHAAVTPSDLSLTILLAPPPTLRLLRPSVLTLPPSPVSASASLLSRASDVILVPHHLHSNSARALDLIGLAVSVDRTSTVLEYCPVGGGVARFSTLEREGGKDGGKEGGGVGGCFPEIVGKDGGRRGEDERERGDEEGEEGDLIDSLGTLPEHEYDFTVFSHRLAGGKKVAEMRGVKGGNGRVVEEWLKRSCAEERG